MGTQTMISTKEFSADFKKEIATKFIEINSPGWNGEGFMVSLDNHCIYEVSGPEKKYYPAAPFVGERLIDINSFFELEGNDFSPEPDWKAIGIPREVYKEFCDFRGQELWDGNGDIPDWLFSFTSEVVAWAAESESWAEWVDEQIKLSFEMAVNFALSNFLDELELRITPDIEV